MRLLARVEARLEHEKPALAPMLDHYGLLFPVEPAELHAFLRQTRFHGDGADLALGTEFGPESHGGGLLRLLFDHWRPGARAPRLDDRYRLSRTAPSWSSGAFSEPISSRSSCPTPACRACAFASASPAGRCATWSSTRTSS